MTTMEMNKTSLFPQIQPGLVRTVLLSGLAAGQQVVVEGMERLSEGVAVTARDWQPADAAAR